MIVVFTVYDSFPRYGPYRRIKELIEALKQMPKPPHHLLFIPSTFSYNRVNRVTAQGLTKSLITREDEIATFHCVQARM